VTESVGELLVALVLDLELLVGLEVTGVVQQELAGGDDGLGVDRFVGLDETGTLVGERLPKRVVGVRRWDGRGGGLEKVTSGESDGD
jgi:hypothetical protein